MSKTFKDTAAFLFLIILAAVILSPFLFGGKIFLDSDVTNYFYPIFDFYSRALKNGESFLWTPLMYSGFPIYLSQVAGFFDPLNRLLFGYFSTINAYHLRLFIDFSWLFAFSYLAGRAFGFSRLAAALIGPSYLSAFHWMTSSSVVASNTLFLLPLLFWVFKKQFAEKFFWHKTGWSLLGGFGIGWALLAGNAQMTVYILFLFGLFCVLYFFFGHEGKKDFRSFAKLAGLILLMVLIGVLIGLPQIIPALKFTPFTIRSGGISYTKATIKGIGLGDFFNFLFPNNLYFPYLAPGRKPLYIGALWFFLAIVAVVLFRKKKEITIFASLFSFALLASLSGSPLFYLLQKLPVFAYFRHPYKWMFIGSFFLAMLGAFGFDLLREGVKNDRLKIVFKYIAFVVGVIVLFFSALNFLGNNFWVRAGSNLDLILGKFLYGRFGFSKDPLHYKDAIERGIGAWREFVSFSDIYFFISCLSLLAGAGLISAFLYQRLSWQKFRIFSFGAVLITFLGTSLGQFSNNIERGPILSSHQKLVDKFIPKEDRNIYRIYPFLVDQGFVERVPPKFKLTLEELRAITELRFAAGKSNLNIFADMPSVEGYDPFIPRDLLRVLGIMGSTESAEEETDPLTQEEKINRLLKNLDVLGMMAGKYIISGVKLASPELRFLGEQTVSRFNIQIYVYENSSKALPRFYFAKEVVLMPGKNLPDLLKEGKKDFVSRTYLDCKDCKITKKNNKTVLRVVSQKNGFFEFGIQASAPNWLVVSESYLPGWEVEIDGEPSKIIRANGLYMAVEVPVGEHKVTFEYNGIIGEASILKKFGIIK